MLGSDGCYYAVKVLTAAASALHAHGYTFEGLFLDYMWVARPFLFTLVVLTVPFFGAHSLQRVYMVAIVTLSLSQLPSLFVLLKILAKVTIPNHHTSQGPGVRRN